MEHDLVISLFIYVFTDNFNFSTKGPLVRATTLFYLFNIKYNKYLLLLNILKVKTKLQNGLLHRIPSLKFHDVSVVLAVAWDYAKSDSALGHFRAQICLWGILHDNDTVQPHTALRLTAMSIIVTVDLP